jgi:hypothetical protein
MLRRHCHSKLAWLTLAVGLAVAGLASATPDNRAGSKCESAPSEFGAFHSKLPSLAAVQRLLIPPGEALASFRAAKFTLRQLDTRNFTPVPISDSAPMATGILHGLANDLEVAQGVSLTEDLRLKKVWQGTTSRFQTEGLPEPCGGLTSDPLCASIASRFPVERGPPFSRAEAWPYHPEAVFIISP